MADSNEKGELMQNKLQSEKPKRKRKQEIPVCTFETRHKNDLSTPESRKKVMLEFLNLARTGKYTYIVELTTQLEHEEDYYSALAHEYPELKPLYKLALQHLGKTGLTGVRDFKYKESSIYRYLYAYLPSHAQAEEREDERKTKQNESLAKAVNQQECICLKFNIFTDNKQFVFDKRCSIHAHLAGDE